MTIGECIISPLSCHYVFINWTMLLCKGTARWINKSILINYLHQIHKITIVQKDLVVAWTCSASIDSLHAVGS